MTGNIPEDITEEQFELVVIPEENAYGIRLTCGPYEDIKYKYNKCSLDEDGENAILHFEYDILEDIDDDYDVKDFENHIGNVLIYLIQEYVKENKVIYSGGEGEIEGTKEEDKE